MSPELPIVCKPTRWFVLRAAAMLLMFSFFAVYFAYDGAVGYRKKNEAFYYNRTISRAGADFAAKNSDGSLTAEAWKAFAAEQSVDFPEDRSILPTGIEIPTPWPELLHDFDKMKSLQTNRLWIEYSGSRGWSDKVREKPYDAREIREQWIVFWVCLALALAAAFLLIRTLLRSFTADEEGITTQQGKRIPYGDLKLLDLRKWDTKGIAFADYSGAAGKGRVRIDGLTYGGFRKEDGEPAEKMMQAIRAKFSGEIIEYTIASDDEKPRPGGSIE